MIWVTWVSTLRLAAASQAGSHVSTVCHLGLSKLFIEAAPAIVSVHITLISCAVPHSPAASQGIFCESLRILLLS